MSRILPLVAAAALAAGCIDKPPRPSEREQPDGGGGDGDGGTGGCGAEPVDERMAWLETDEIRFNQRVGQIDGDCRDDVVIPGSRAAGVAPGVFVVLGRESGFMEGFDDFIDTPNQEQPIDLALTRLVGGDEALDLMVVASKDQDTVVLVYKGRGTGHFDFFSSKTIEALELQAGTPDFPSPTFLLVAQLEADGPPSLVLGDSVTTRIMSPTDWDEASAISGADVVSPPDFQQDSQTQELGIVGASGREVDDLFDMGTVTARWYANQDGVDSFNRSPGFDPGIEGPGPSVFLDMDADGDPDVTSIRFEAAPQLETLVLVPGAVSGDFGTIAETARLDSGLAEAGNTFSDFALADLGGGSQPEAVLIDAAFDDGAKRGTKLAVYPDLAVDGAVISASGTPATSVTEHALADGDPDRLFIGKFREDVTEILAVGSAPAVGNLVCRVLTADLDLAACE